MVPKTRNVFSVFNRTLGFAVAALITSQFTWGLDLGVFNATQGMDAFARDFGVWNAKKQEWVIQPWFLSLLNSLNYAGQAVGVVVGGWMSRRYGRRIACYWMSACFCLSGVLLISATHKEQLLVGRILTYLASGVELTVVPVFESEIVPRTIRGMVVGTYQFGALFGGLVASIICYGTNRIDGAAAYRIPFAFFFVSPLIVVVGVYFMPESPRWYLIHDRPEEALAALRKYRQGRFTDEEIMEEYNTQVATISTSAARGTFKEIWQGTNLRRTLIVAGSNLAMQGSGQALGTKYSVVLLKDINALDPFKMSCIASALFIVVIMAALWLSDNQRVGRRPVLLIGAFTQSASMFITGGLGAVSKPTYNVLATESAMLVIYYAGFCFGWAAIGHTITAEIPNSRNRDMTYVVASIVNVVTQFTVAFTLPYLWYAPYAALGTKVGFIFGGTCLLGFIFAYFCVPECCRLTLEEIDHLFEQRVPTLKFKKYRHGEIISPEVTEIVSVIKNEERATVEEREVA